MNTVGSTLLAAMVCLASLGSSACTSYQYAKNVKLVSFDDNVTTGHSVGPVRGEDCQNLFLGIPIGDPPSLDQAFAEARKDGGRLRYMNNVSSQSTGFNIFVYGQRCVVVMGAGYQ
jgi:hypothetical protein